MTLKKIVEWMNVADEELNTMHILLLDIKKRLEKLEEKQDE